MVIRYIDIKNIKKLPNLGLNLKNLIYLNLKYTYNYLYIVSNNSKNLFFFRYFFWIFYNNHKYYNFLYFLKYYIYIINLINLLNYYKFNNVRYYIIYYLNGFNLNSFGKIIQKKYINYLFFKKNIDVLFFLNNNNYKLNLFVNLLNSKYNLINLNLLNTNLLLFFLYLNYL